MFFFTPIIVRRLVSGAAQEQDKYGEPCHQTIEDTNILTDFSSDALGDLGICKLDLFLDLVQTLLDLKELGIYPAAAVLPPPASSLTSTNHRVSSECTRVFP